MTTGQLVGQQLGNYRLIRFLADGGFAEVYLGEHKELGSPAAIKVLKASLPKDEIAKFRTEATTIAKLIHPNIVRVFDFGIEGNTLFMVMDYAPNGTLRDRHPQGSRVPLALIVSYVKQIAEALQYAHDNKIIHRDIKPENIFVVSNKEILVGDFGIAVTAHSTLTQQPQNIIGTVAYMAPEQIQHYPRPASDQYALAIMVYEWLSGTLPFDGTDREIAVKHLTVLPPSLHAKIPTVSLAVEQVIFQALEKNRKQRFASVQEFADALEQACNSKQTANFALPPRLIPTPAAPPPVQPIPQPNQLLHALDYDKLYREGMMARSAGNLERAFTLWQQILQHNPHYKNGTLVPQMDRLLEELYPLRSKRLRKQADEARRDGAWQQEIDSWNALVSVENQWRAHRGGNPKRASVEQEAKEHISIAKQNLQYAWMYENAVQFINNGNQDAAKTTLQELWQHAPYYGDPSNLAKYMIVQVPPSYEKAKTMEEMSRHLSEHLDIWIISLFLLGVLGWGVNRSWFWIVVVTVSLTAVFVYLWYFLVDDRNKIKVKIQQMLHEIF